jgi:hypothetical protein
MCRESRQAKNLENSEKNEQIEHSDGIFAAFSSKVSLQTTSVQI